MLFTEKERKKGDMLWEHKKLETRLAPLLEDFATENDIVKQAMPKNKDNLEPFLQICFSTPIEWSD